MDGCRVALERRATEPVLRLRASCPLTADATRDALARLLAASFGTAGVPPGIRSVALGRLDVFPWLAERLATAAARDPGWDAARGIPRRGHPNAYVASLLDRGALHVELVRVLRAAGAVVRGSAVEKVLVAQAGATPVAAALADAGVAPRSAIPFDAQVWLVLEPAPPAPAPPHDSLHEPH